MPKPLSPPAKQATLTVSRLPIAKLKPHPKNPRRHPKPGSAEWLTLKKSLEAEYFDPLVWNKRNGMLVSGHLRAKVLDEGGFTVADCVVVDWDEQTHLARMIAANKLEGQEDSAVLADVLKELCAVEGFDLELTGFTPQEIGDFGFLDPKKPDEDDDHVAQLLDKAAALQKKWKTRRGQLWSLGDHRLLCGDALDPDSWKRLGGPFNCCFADPPYELVVNVATFRGAATKRDLLLMATDKLFLQQSANGFRSFLCYTFDSAGKAPWTTTPLRQHTLIGWWRWVEHKSSFKGLSSVIHHAGGNQESDKKGKHGQAKLLPTTLLPYFVQKGEAFADAFAGAGSTLMAAEGLKIAARSVELEPGYVAVILERWAGETERTPKLLGSETSE